MPRVLSASMSSNLSTKFADGRAREFMWGVTLTKDEPEHIWSFEEEDEDKDFLEHTLFLRHAVLGEDAVKDERNLVSIETKNFAGDDLKHPLFSLTHGKSDMCQLDINFGHELPVTFRLIQGTGPVHISAQHLVGLSCHVCEPEFPPENLDDTEMTEYTATEDDLSEGDVDEEEDEELETSTKGAKGKKRKVSVDKGAAKKKKGKAEESSEDEEDEDEDEEEESMDEEEDDDDDDEEEEPTPEKKKAKGKTKNVKGKKASKPAPAKKGKKKSK